jgi:hypothetical protein
MAEVSILSVRAFAMGGLILCITNLEKCGYNTWYGWNFEIKILDSDFPWKSDSRTEGMHCSFPWNQASPGGCGNVAVQMHPTMAV